MQESTISRRELLKRGAAGATLLSAGSLLNAGSAFGRSAAGLQTVRWISPRGTLQVMDDFNLWVPIKMGYFKSLGINAQLGHVSMCCTRGARLPLSSSTIVVAVNVCQPSSFSLKTVPHLSHMRTLLTCRLPSS